MNESCAAVPCGVDEFVHARLEKAPSRLVAPPRVKAAKVNFERKVADIVTLKSAAGVPAGAWLVLGEVVGGHIAQEMLKDGVFDTFGAGILLRGGRVPMRRCVRRAGWI